VRSTLSAATLHAPNRQTDHEAARQTECAIRITAGQVRNTAVLLDGLARAVGDARGYTRGSRDARADVDVQLDVELVRTIIHIACLDELTVAEDRATFVFALGLTRLDRRRLTLRVGLLLAVDLTLRVDLRGARPAACRAASRHAIGARRHLRGFLRIAALLFATLVAVVLLAETASIWVRCTAALIISRLTIIQAQLASAGTLLRGAVSRTAVDAG